MHSLAEIEAKAYFCEGLAANGLNIANPNPLTRIFDYSHQCVKHLIERYQAQAQRCLTRGGNEFHQPVHRQQHIRPAMSGAEHVPGPEDRRIQAALLDDLFALLPNGDVGFHRRRGMGHADEDEMAGVCFHCCRMRVNPR